MFNTEMVKFKDLQIKTPEGWKDFDGIAKLPDQSLFKFMLEDGKFIIVNLNHNFSQNNIPIKARNLVEGECIDTKDGLKKIKNIEYVGEGDVYDVLEVSEIHKYLSNGIVNFNCKFLGSSNTLIEGDTLEQIDTIDPIVTKWSGLLQIYELPQPNKLYIMGVDTSEGTGNDFSVIQILRIDEEFKVEQVAVYKCNTIDVSKFAQVCCSVSEYYNNAFMMIENNGVGSILANIIWHEYEYDYILNCDKTGLGIRSTKKSKLSGNLLLKRYLEEGWLILHDKATVYELSLYEEVKPDVYRCGTYEHDDHVTSLIWALYFLITSFFDGKSMGVKAVDDKYKIQGTWDDETPIVIFDNEYAEDFDGF